MDTEENKKGFVKVQNWLGKLTLYIIAAIWLVSDLYPHIMSNFFLTERDVPDWGTWNDVSVLLACGAMILGGYYLNTVFDFFKTFKPKK